MRIGIVSDTHDRILPGLFSALAGVDEILHAGDICSVEALAEIEAIAPVTAVHGNMDDRGLAGRLPEMQRIEREGVVIALLHGHLARRGDIASIGALAAGDPAPDLVIFGHSHERLSRSMGGTRYFNPGTAGGIGAAPTAGLLTIERGGFTIDHIELSS